MTTVTVESRFLGPEVNYHEFALFVHKEFSGIAYGSYLTVMYRDYRADLKEAQDLLFAGYAYKHKALGTWLRANNIRYQVAARFTEIARTLEGEWTMPDKGKVKVKQLDEILNLAKSINFADVNAGLRILRGAARKHNEEWEEAQKAKKEKEYEERKAAGISVKPEQGFQPNFEDLLPVLPAAHPHENPPEPTGASETTITTEPGGAVGHFPTDIFVGEDKAYWTTEDLSARFYNIRPGYNGLVIEGISDLDVAVMRDAMRRLHGELPEEVKNAPVEVRDGHAIHRILVDSFRRSEATAKVRFNIVVSLDNLEQHPEWVAFYEGRSYTPFDIFSLTNTWGAEENLLVRNFEGRVISLATVRLSPETFRIIWQAQGGRCIMPFCNKQHDLEYHHLEDYKDTGRTDLWGVRPLCKHHHKMVTKYPGRLEVFDQWLTSAWVSPSSGEVSVDLCVAPTSTLLQAQGEKHGLDPLVPEEFDQLRKILILETKKHIDGIRREKTQ
ncbi:MAG: HNH endonuclease signature motif containing protein [Corynebacterium sp.]|nr:HNH endonuclease signature motif containing protein [Corynebacterium sp.]